MSERDLLIAEVEQHKSDIQYGMPLDLGEIKIAMHAADCPRCAYLARKAALEKK